MFHFRSNPLPFGMLLPFHGLVFGRDEGITVRVIIAGGGTGGLATAIALREAGIEPLVLEQASAFTAIGAGLGLYANAMKALTYLGADAYWRENVARIDVSEQRGLNDDELITSSSLDAQAAKYGEHYYCGHRADLLSSLLAPLPPGCVRTGSRVVAFEETGRDVRVELESGEEIRGDLLVGADGLRSRTREQLMGEREARFTGVVVWRGLIPLSPITGSPPSIRSRRRWTTHWPPTAGWPASTRGSRSWSAANARAAALLSV